MLVDLYLLKNFNNYFNKKVRKKSSLNAYLGSVSDNFKVSSTNFNPNDGVTASHIVGSANNPFADEEGNELQWNPDYVLVVNPDTNEILSRWFVLEFVRTMAGQYSVSLKRDVVADYYENVINCPTYIEKGHLENDDPFIVNNEGISFNQIKTKEYYLKDETKVPWVVVYLNQYERETKLIKSKFSSPNIIEIENAPELLELFPNIMSATTDQKVNHKVFNDKDFNFTFKYYFSEFAIPIIYGRVGEVRFSFNIPEAKASLIRCFDSLGYHDKYTDFNGSGGVGYVDNGWDSIGSGGGRVFRDVAGDMVNSFKNNFNSNVLSVFNAMGCSHHSTGYVEPDVKKYIGKIIHVGSTGKYFSFDMKNISNEIYENDSSDIKNIACNIFNSISHSPWSLQYDGQVVRVHASTSINTLYQMSINTASDVKLNLIGTRTGATPDNGYQTQLEPYDIICFPAFTTQMTNTDGNKIETIGNAGINIARAMSEQLGSDVLYDVQLLPYCPARELIGTDGDIDLRLANVNQAMPITDNADNIVSYALVSTSPFHGFDIQTLGTSIYDDEEVLCSSELVVDDKKIASNCDMFRLSSPNYASSFEFNLAKCVPINRPEITKFKVDIDFRPYNPYIHIAPDYAFLYGGDFNDSRGLICSGDFGLTTMKNAWTDYQVRNKNYQNIFNREISHLETNRAIAREEENFNIRKSIFGTAGVGLGMGIADTFGELSALGMGGGIAGLIRGGTNIAGAVRQKGWNERKFQENVSYTTDMFNMQMDNIKALPNSITHSASLTNNFKFYPVLEYYTCTDKEKSAFESKLRYNGMTVGRIDTISNYISSDEERFVKGQIIRLDTIADDSHIAMEIYNQINSGVFFEPESV